MFSTSTLSFAQDTPTSEKERNWIVGIGWTPPTSKSTYARTNTFTEHYNATVGYKGFTISYYNMPTEITYQGSDNYPPKVIYNQVRHYFTVGYQHVFSKKSNAEVKPIVGFEYGLSSYVFNTGVRYKRNQVLLSVGTFHNYSDNSRGFLLLPYLREWTDNRYMTIKYQFLF
tara:strand:+ start:25676 stop:26188 length:513 start_codon:yes stop_codon:yes gene_type:complete